MRESRTETRIVEQQVFVEEYVKCDLCGFDEEPFEIFEVRVEVGADDCVGTRITRDVCQSCYDEKLEKFLNPLFEALDASNEDMLELREEDRWYG